jgi:hypothetical protein
MTIWNGGHGWGWCSVMFNIPATVLLWGAVVAAIVIAVRVAVRQQSDPPAPTGAGHPSEGMVATRFARSEIENDDFHRRLM